VRAALLLAGTLALTAQQSTIHTVDGLNRPLPGVEITVYCGNRPHHLSSDANGHARGPFDKKTCTSASVAKAGYTAYSTGLRDRYILNRKLTAIDVERLINTGTSDAIRELLASDTPKLNDAIFQFEHRLRPILRALLKDPQVTLPARDFLAMIADPEDIKQLVALPSPPGEYGWKERWHHPVVTALIHPTTEAEWKLLERCVNYEFQDWWLVNGAIQSLQLNATPRSKAILESAGQKNPKVRERIQPAPPDPPTLTHPELETAAKLVAQTLGPKTWQGNKAPRFNEAADKALIDLTFQIGFDYLIYTATFHKTNESWTLRNVYETYQAFSPPPPPPPKP
jgi:hypothetical protein